MSENDSQSTLPDDNNNNNNNNKEQILLHLWSQQLVYEWFQKSRFAEYADKFTEFTGERLSRLSEVELKELINDSKVASELLREIKQRNGERNNDDIRRGTDTVESANSSGSGGNSSGSDDQMNRHHKKRKDKKEKIRKKERKRKLEKKSKKDKKRKKHKPAKEPVQLSKFLRQRKEDSSSSSESSENSESDSDANTPRSVISGKKIKMKVRKTKEMKVREVNRQQLLQFLNAQY